MKVIILRFWQLKVLVFSSDKQLRAAFMAVTVVTVLFLTGGLFFQTSDLLFQTTS